MIIMVLLHILFLGFAKAMQLSATIGCGKMYELCMFMSACEAVWTWVVMAERGSKLIVPQLTCGAD